jgi:hypothetical protein
VTYGDAVPTITAGYSGFVNSENESVLDTAPTCTTTYTDGSPASPPTYPSSCSGGVDGNYNFSYVAGAVTVNKANANCSSVTGYTLVYDGNSHTATGSCLGVDGETLAGLNLTGTTHTDVGIYNDTWSFTDVTGNYNNQGPTAVTDTINKRPTTLVLDITGHSFINFDCTNNKIKVTLTDTLTTNPISGASVTISISGGPSTTVTTDSSGMATWEIILQQAPGGVTVSAAFAGSTTQLNSNDSESATVTGDPNVAPAPNATSLYTGSLFFWTTGPSSSTATLTLSATVKDTGPCFGDIAKAKVSFLISTNGPTGQFNPVSNAQNLPVGYVNPSDHTVGAASAISQYNIGSADFVTLIVRVRVSGLYAYNDDDYDIPITIGKAGIPNSLTGGGQLNNDGSPFYASGYLGLNSINSVFSSYVVYNKKGVNPQGQVTLTVRSCNTRFGTPDPNCNASDPATHHVYWIKSNSISELSLISGSASFGAKTNGYELLSDGSKVNFDSGNSIQLVFTPFGQAIPRDMYSSPESSAFANSTKVCTNAKGCASVVLFRSAGGVWYSSSWGTGSGTSVPHTYEKAVLNGCVSVGGSAPSTPTISEATAGTTPTTTPSAPMTMNAPAEPQSLSTMVGAAFFAGNGSLKENVSATSATTADVVSTRRFFAGRVEAVNSKTETVFVGDGAVGKNWIVSTFANSLELVTSGTAADGRVTVTVRSCNKPDGSVDTRCVAAKPATHHVYVFETRDFPPSSVVADVSTLESTGAMYEVLTGGEKRILAKDVAMQIIFVPENQMIPLTIGATGGFSCAEKLGCAAIAARRADGGLWYSGAWALKASSNVR